MHTDQILARMRIAPFLTGAAGLVLALSAGAGDSSPAASPATGTPPVPPAKGSYHLFNPTPTALLRELRTDRPDKTESPYTVDAGHFQIESDLVAFSHDRDTRGGADTRADAWSIGAVNLKAGLCNQADLQVVVETYNHLRTADLGAGTVTRQSGFGDVTLRLKGNLWGNDSGRTAFAVMPFVKLPTNQDDLGNDAVESGVILPLAVELPAGWGMGVMTEFDFVQDGDGSGHHTEFVNTLTFGHDLVGRLAGYVEFFSAVSTEADAEWVGTVDLGLTYGLSKNVQLDAGVNLGVTRSAADVNPFLGLSVRF